MIAFAINLSRSPWVSPTPTKPWLSSSPPPPPSSSRLSSEAAGETEKKPAGAGGVSSQAGAAGYVGACSSSMNVRRPDLLSWELTANSDRFVPRQVGQVRSLILLLQDPPSPWLAEPPSLSPLCLCLLTAAASRGMPGL